jgi:hypothetical protein
MDDRYIYHQIATLIKNRDALLDILDDGANQITAAKNEGKDVTLMEDTWNKMLNDYGNICDQIRDLHQVVAV